MRISRKPFGKHSPLLLERTDITEKYKKGELQSRRENILRVQATPVFALAITVLLVISLAVSPEARALASGVIELGKE